ncbi:MAG: T9SS type A sorting domain-containing protein, partial [Paramuribaculum sp.]|nr:T9SS type A sorting domain-containing protein [Paramuribaculum sp.]
AKAAANPSVWGGCNVIVIEQDVDAIDDITSDRFSTEINGSSIIISGLDPADLIEVFDLTGTCVFRTSAPSSGTVSTGILRKGIYIVRDRRNSVKVKI